MAISYSSQVFSNNATATLVSAISPSDTAISISDGSRFPGVSTSSDYFLVTLDDGYNVEVVKVTSVVGNTLSGCTRGYEGTVARSFAAATPVEVRLTAGTVKGLYAKNEVLTFTSSLDDLTRPSLLNNHTYVVTDGDETGSPVLVLADRVNNVWTFPTFPGPIHSSTSDATGTTTSIAFISAEVAARFVPNGMIVQFTSGFNKGACRKVTSISGARIQWATPLASAPASGDSYKVYQSISSRLVQIEAAI